MKTLKKFILIVFVAITYIITCSAVSKATTLEVTTDTLNLRKEATTDSDILTLISMGEKCELIEKSGDWYKVTYEDYTGYVSKEYVKEVGESSTENIDNNNEDTNQEDSQENKQNDNEQENKETINTIEITTLTSTTKTNCEIKIVPLINSSTIGTIAKGKTLTVISTVNGWTYVQNEELAGWVRSEALSEVKTTNTTSKPEQEEVTNTTQEEIQEETTNTTAEQNTTNNEEAENNNSGDYEKWTGYVNDVYVNVRKEASTDSTVLMVLELNTELTVIGEEGDWYKVTTSSGEAYVSKELISDKKVTTSRSETPRTEKTTTDNNSEKATSVTDTSTNNKVENTSSTKGEQIVEYAKKFLGVPYVYGGASPSGFDCSGFTMYVYSHFGKSIPHGAQSQAKLGTVVNADKNSSTSLKNNLQPGDLVFFLDYETMDEIGHCGIYIGNGNFIHASSGSGYCVKTNSLLPGEYYNTRYCGARRII